MCLSRCEHAQVAAADAAVLASELSSSLEGDAALAHEEDDPDWAPLRHYLHMLQVRAVVGWRREFPCAPSAGAQQRVPAMQLPHVLRARMHSRTVEVFDTVPNW